MIGSSNVSNNGTSQPTEQEARSRFKFQVPRCPSLTPLIFCSQRQHQSPYNFPFAPCMQSDLPIRTSHGKNNICTCASFEICLHRLHRSTRFNITFLEHATTAPRSSQLQVRDGPGNVASINQRRKETSCTLHLCRIRKRARESRVLYQESPPWSRGFLLRF